MITCVELAVLLFQILFVTAAKVPAKSVLEKLTTRKRREHPDLPGTSNEISSDNKKSGVPLNDL